MAPEPTRRLGRGLEALIGGASPRSPAPADKSALQQLPISQIRANPFQPRKDFRPGELAELEASLKSSGLLQPITVRPLPNSSGFELVAGERRLRAATNIGWTDISAVIKEIDDRAMLTLALIENLQRADLNPIEEAEGYQRLAQEFGLTQQQIADAVGKDRSTIANLLRLLQLPDSVRALLRAGSLTTGHARALLSLESGPEMESLAKAIVEGGLSVREVERRVRGPVPVEIPTKPNAAPSVVVPPAVSAEAKRIEEQLRRYFQTDVKVSLAANDRGEIRLSFYSSDDLERVLDLMMGSTRDA